MHFTPPISTPFGHFKLVMSEKGIKAVILLDDAARSDDIPSFQVEAIKQFEEYFSRERREFNLSIDLKGTSFQRKVWEALLGIPYGTTATYGDIAKKIGNPKAVRAVGRAIGQNPLPILIPCHRVIGANGTLTGFSLGLELKKQLLDLEQKES